MNLSSLPDRACQTYLPILRDPDLYYLLRDQDYEGLTEQLRSVYPYERVGLDRLLAILIDLGRMRILPPARILDIGCNTGLFALGLVAKGYRVVGVDSNIAAEVQGFYPGNIIGLAQQQASGFFERLQFVESEISDFLVHNHETYEVGLLLSVVHQWQNGYATSGQGKKSFDQVEDILIEIISRISRIIYYEGPDENVMPRPDRLVFPQWFCDASLVKQATPVAISAAANGELRTLYRLTR